MDVEIDIDVEWGRVRAIPVLATAVDKVVIVGECRLCGWSLRDIANNVAPSQSGNASGAYAAAAAGNVSLANISAILSGFDVTMQAPVADVSGLVTVTNVSGGPYVYDFVAGPGNENILSVRYPNPLSRSGGTPNVAISAIVGGAAGNINVYGVTSDAGTAAEIRDGGQILGKTGTGPGLSDTQFFGDKGLRVMDQIVLHPLSGTIEGVIYVRYRD